MLVHQVRDMRVRWRALQLDAFSCAAAATADALADIGDWSPAAALQAQKKLIRVAGGQGTTLERIRRAAASIFPAFAIDEKQLLLEDAIAEASGGVGVVLALDSPTGQGPGHAVHLLAGDVPDLGPFASLPPVRRRQILSPLAMDFIVETQVFDPWPGPERYPEMVRFGTLRGRFESFGCRALLVCPRTIPPALRAGIHWA